MKIAICAIGYNRVDSLSRLLYSLNAAVYDEDVTLVISLDRSKTLDVKTYSDEFVWKHGEKKVILQECNLGLRKHVLRCGQYMNDYDFDALVVLEDDITVSPYFYSYVKQCVAQYKDDDCIAGISLYNFPINYITEYPFTPVDSEHDVYLMNCAMSWGQVWMKEKWNKFIDWYNCNDEEFSLPHLPVPINQWPKSSWLKYHTRYCIEKDLYFVYPYVSLTTNNSDPGTHNKVGHTYMQSRLQCMPRRTWSLPPSSKIEVRYDGFFEPKFLYTHLHIGEEQLSINIYGTKANSKKRYELSMNVLPYKVVKSFGLKYKPIEANVLLDIDGKDIYLYDKSQRSLMSSVCPNNRVIEYFYFNIFDKLCIWHNLKYAIFNYFRYHYLNKFKK